MTESGGSESPQSHNWRSSPHPPNSPAASSSTNSPSPITELLPETQAGPSKVPKRKLRHKVTSTGVWPCKINGCNKEFAREADLKRHQRTTKTHSMPSFCCPQCDASFTRTDALRRHQKSRHDGILLDPTEQNKGDENSQSSSPTSTSPKGKEKGDIVVRQQSIYERPTSYYRAHTAMTTPYIPPQLHYLPPGTQITHPTSATRTGPPWPSYFAQNSDYRPSPYYRPHTANYVSTESPADATLPSDPSNPLHPSLATCSSTKEITPEEVLAAVEAVLLQTASKSHSDANDSNQPSANERSKYSIMSVGVDHPMDERLALELHGYESTYHGPMEHLMTEDGEPMLNPAELLTQESLAESPPPG